MIIFHYLCCAFEDAQRLKAAAQHSSSELGSAFVLHFNCKWKIEEVKETEGVEESEAKCPGNGG
ncbi:MAG: hypothetical protein IKQ03_04610 [Prevotella sp.]|nr:hypothetical protein [Prevotella sp.]